MTLKRSLTVLAAAGATLAVLLLGTPTANATTCPTPPHTSSLTCS